MTSEPRLTERSCKVQRGERLVGAAWTRRSLPPGQIAVPFDVSERHFVFDTFDLVGPILVSHHFTRDGEDGRYRRGNSRHRYA